MNAPCWWRALVGLLLIGVTLSHPPQELNNLSELSLSVFSDVAIRAKPGCTQCAVLEALFDEVAAVPDLDGIHFLEVDLNRFPGVAKEFGVSHVPALMRVKDGLAYEYTGLRQLSSLTEFVKSPSGVGTPVPAPFRNLVFLSDANYTDVFDGKWLLSVYVPWCGTCLRAESMLLDLLQHQSVYRVAKIDVLESSDFIHRFGFDRRLDKYPIYLRWDSGNFQRYEGDPSSKEDVEQFMMEGNGKAWQKKPGPVSALYNFAYYIQEVFKNPASYVFAVFFFVFFAYMLFVYRSSKKVAVSESLPKKGSD